MGLTLELTPADSRWIKERAVPGPGEAYKTLLLASNKAHNCICLSQTVHRYSNSNSNLRMALEFTKVLCLLCIVVALAVVEIESSACGENLDILLASVCTNGYNGMTKRSHGKCG